jgi:hypothetical protein
MEVQCIFKVWICIFYFRYWYLDSRFIPGNTLFYTGQYIISCHETSVIEFVNCTFANLEISSTSVPRVAFNIYCPGFIGLNVTNSVFVNLTCFFFIL